VASSAGAVIAVPFGVVVDGRHLADLHVLLLGARRSRLLVPGRKAPITQFCGFRHRPSARASMAAAIV